MANLEILLVCFWVRMTGIHCYLLHSYIKSSLFIFQYRPYKFRISAISKEDKFNFKCKIDGCIFHTCCITMTYRTIYWVHVVTTMYNACYQFPTDTLEVRNQRMSRIQVGVVVNGHSHIRWSQQLNWLAYQKEGNGQWQSF